MTTSEQIDLTLINGYLEALDLTVIHQMLDLYSQQSQLYLTAIDSAVVAEDQSLWQEQCHKMKGAAASTGLKQVHQKLIAIEKSTQAWPTKAEYVQALRRLNKNAIAAFERWLAEH
jgi:HPt (histidine-containing phosphotransfer) domain-containing protein